MKPVVVAEILQEALHGILALPTGFITRWTSKNQILIQLNDYNNDVEIKLVPKF